MPIWFTERPLLDETDSLLTKEDADKIRAANKETLAKYLIKEQVKAYSISFTTEDALIVEKDTKEEEQYFL